MNRIIFFLLFFISCSQNSHVDMANTPIAKIASIQSNANGLPIKFGNLSEYSDDPKNSESRQHEWTINLNKNLVTILGFEKISNPFSFPGIKTNSTYQSFEVIDWSLFLNHFGIALLNDGDEICVNLRVLNAAGIQSEQSNEVCGSYDLIPSAPVAFNDSINTIYLTPVIADVLINDTDPDNNIDSNSISITVNANTLTQGSCTVSGTSPNKILFTPVAGFSGLATCTYQMCDTTSLCSPAVLSVTVGAPRSPIANADSASALYLSSVTVDVLANDSDPDNDININSISITTNANTLTQGSCTVSGTSPNKILFTPVAGFSGLATCTYQMCDATSLCASAILSITIGAPHSPVANSDSATSSYNTSVTVDVLANDTDSDNDINTNSISITTNANTLTQGSCTVSGTSPNKILFTPVAGFSGLATCTYQMCDATSLCASAILSITISSGASPTLSDDSKNGTNQSVSIADVISNDSDPDSNLPSYNDLNLSSLAITSNANTTTEGSCSVVAGKINFTPISSFIGTATCTYELCDKQTPTANCSNADVDFVISAVPFAGTFIGTSTNNVADTGGFTATGMNTHLTASGTSSYENMNGFTVGTGLASVSNTLNGITYTIKHYDENVAAPLGSLHIGTQRNFSVTNPVSQGSAAGTTIGIESVGGSSTSRNSFLFSFSSPIGYFSIDTLDLESSVSFTFGTIIVYDASNNIIATDNIDYMSDDGNNLIHFIGYISNSLNISHVQIIVGDDSTGGGKTEQLAIDNLRFGTKTGIYP